MSTPFSAGPQALGYLHQARYALYALLSDDRAEAAVAVEGLDDVTVEGDGLLKLDQLKHHIREAATLTDYSPELWKTLRVWSDSLYRNEWKPEEVTLNLITTAQAGDDSVAAFLRKGEGRDQVKAHKQLLSIADKSSNHKLLPAFEAFKALRIGQQERLIGAITIVDSAPNIQDIVSLIKKELRRSTAAEYIDSLYERLEGWWFDKVVMHLLNESKLPITQLELDEKIVLIADQFKRDSLPIDYAYDEPAEGYFTDSDNRVFVQQLNHLKLNTKRVRNAVLDYYRAFEQRSRWVREKLYIDDELTFYEKRLKQEWGRYIATLEDEFDEIISDDNCMMFGRRVLTWMESVDLPIRSKMPMNHEYVTRGSYHILADVHPPDIYWHPKFVEYLDVILATK